MSIIDGLCNDSPIHLLLCSYLGSCLVDIATIGRASNIDKSHCKVLVSYYEHPKKAALEEFYMWLQAYCNESDAILSRPFCTTVYADIGVRATTSGNKSGASAYSLCRGNNKEGQNFVLIEDSFKCSLVTPFDAKISVAASGIEKAVDLIRTEFMHKSLSSPEWHDSNRYVRTLVLCIDNQAAALSILSGSMKLEHAPAVCAATKIKDFLDLHPMHKFIAMWVPSHTADITFGGASMPHFLSTRGNDRVDKLCMACLNNRNPIPST
jgi:hypothetical protein